MTITLRDRPDGQVELVAQQPVVIGILADRDLAARFVAFLKVDEPEIPDDEPASFARAKKDAAEAGEMDLADIAATVSAGVIVAEAQLASRPRRRAQLPAVIDRPQPPAILPVERPALTEAQLDEAFGLLGGGEKLAAVAARYGVPVAQLRGYWGQHCKRVQKHLAEGGQQPCRLCEKPFTPSISNPETCARCSHD